MTPQSKVSPEVLRERRRSHALASAKYRKKNAAQERVKSKQRMANLRRRNKIREMEAELKDLREDYRRTSLRRKAFQEREQHLLGRINEDEAALAAFIGHTPMPTEEASDDYTSLHASIDVQLMAHRDLVERDAARNLDNDADETRAVMAWQLEKVLQEMPSSPLPPSSPPPPFSPSLPSSQRERHYGGQVPQARSRSASLPIATDSEDESR